MLYLHVLIHMFMLLFIVYLFLLQGVLRRYYCWYCSQNCKQSSRY